MSTPLNMWWRFGGLWEVESLLEANWSSSPCTCESGQIPTQLWMLQGSVAAVFTSPRTCLCTISQLEMSGTSSPTKNIKYAHQGPVLYIPSCVQDFTCCQWNYFWPIVYTCVRRTGHAAAQVQSNGHWQCRSTTVIEGVGNLEIPIDLCSLTASWLRWRIQSPLPRLLEPHYHKHCFGK